MLSRYPSLNRCVDDKVGEFTEHEFLQLLEDHSIKSVLTTVKNPQSNAVCKCIYQTIANVLRYIMRTKGLPPQQQAEQVMDNALAIIMHATRCAVNNTMKISP